MVKIILLLVKIVTKASENSRGEREMLLKSINIVLIAFRATEKSFQVLYESHSRNCQ